MANLSDFATLADARAFTQPLEREIPLTGVLRILSLSGSDAILFDSVTPRARAFLLSIQAGVATFDLRNSSPVGQQLQALLALLVQDGAVTQEFMDGCIAFCNTTITPFASSTQHDFEVAKGTITRIGKQAVDGWLKITTSADCEAHRPQVHVDVQGVIRRVAGFDVVSVAGDYVTQVPRGYTSYFVDNAYSVVS